MANRKCVVQLWSDLLSQACTGEGSASSMCCRGATHTAATPGPASTHANALETVTVMEEASPWTNLQNTYSHKGQAGRSLSSSLLYPRTAASQLHRLSEGPPSSDSPQCFGNVASNEALAVVGHLARNPLLPICSLTYITFGTHLDAIHSRH